MAYSSPNSILGGKGVKKTSKQAKRAKKRSRKKTKDALEAIAKVQKIADKAKFHLADALRYIVAALRPMDGNERVIDRIKPKEEKVEPMEDQLEQFRTNTWSLEQERLKMPSLGLKQVKVV